MQLACVLLRSPHTIYYNVRDQFLMQQSIGIDMKTNKFHHFPFTIRTREYNKKNGNGCKKKHQLIEPKHLHPKYSMKQDRTCP